MVDYSKWKNIEISDDEDEIHPNVDTPSLFRWRHKARLDRMEEEKREKEEFEKRKETHSKKYKEIQEKLKDAENKEASNVETLKKELQQIKKEGDEIKAKEDEIKKKEKKTPWNVDTISQEGFTKTVVNKKPSRPKEDNLTEEEREQKLKTFITKYEKELKNFGMLRRYDDSKKYLKEKQHLVCADTANYLVIWCINLQMEEKSELMAHVAHQTICMQYILELAKQLDCDPRACVDAFFARIQVAEPEYKASFEDELVQFKERIRKRALEKLEEAEKEVEEEELKERIGPGGLDPIDVFESLPDELKQCFESRNIELLQETIAKMEEKDAHYHMKRCVDSGLWVPEGNKNKTEKDDEDAAETSSKSDKPPEMKS